MALSLRRWNVSEERVQILEMLAAGRVTVEQAEQLLDAVSSPPSTSCAPGPAGDMFVINRPTVEELDALDEHGVSDTYIEQMRAAGLELNFLDLVRLHDHGVEPAFVGGMRDAGFTALTRDDLLLMVDHGIDLGFVRAMHEVGLIDPTPRQLVELFDHGVDAAFVKEMRALGFGALAPDDWVKLRDHGVDSAFARAKRG